MENKYEKGLKNRNKVFGSGGEERRKEFEEVNPDFAKFITENIFGDLYERTGIDDKTREMIILAILCALGKEREFGIHIHAALNVGMTKEEIQELLMVCAFYAGVPNTVASTNATLNVFKERKIKS
ncbi:MAG: carboxymuconolactone decarboxylase family protein [Nitrospinota bacterium]|nr:carboxymuconolactone decarboxylase family protein [Nitrospinota bacterium]